MKRAMLWGVVLAVGGGIGWLAASGRLEQAFAQPAKPAAPPPGTQLPKPDPDF